MTTRTPLEQQVHEELISFIRENPETTNKQAQKFLNNKLPGRYKSLDAGKFSQIRKDLGIVRESKGDGAWATTVLQKKGKKSTKRAGKKPEKKSKSQEIRLVDLGQSSPQLPNKVSIKLKELKTVLQEFGYSEVRGDVETGKWELGRAQWDVFTS